MLRLRLTEKKKRIRKSKEERIAEKNVELEKALAKVAKLKAEKKDLEQDKESSRKTTSHRKIIAGAVALKMIRQKQDFNRESFKAALLASAKTEADKSYFEKMFNG